MSKDPKIIRKGDWIRVEEPQFFVRCGYPKTLKSEALAVAQEFSTQVDALLHEVKIPLEFSWGSPWGRLYNKVRERILRALAFGRLGTFGFGGKERKIYTEVCPEYQDRECEVSDVFFVKTGIYYAPSVSHSYEGYDEYEEGGLEDQQTHKILVLNLGSWNWMMHNRGPMIEASRVVKIMSEEAKGAGALQHSAKVPLKGSTPYSDS